MTGPKKPLVREVNPHLICVLCSGYFIEATTIVECLHTFCRSCLIKYLEKNKFCPICDVQLHKNNPLLSVRCDPTLQRLVYKLVPGLYAKEMARRKKYYSELGGPSSDSDNFEYPVPDAYFAPTDCISLSLEFLSAAIKEEDSGSDGDDTTEKQSVHHRRYLQCPAAVNMSHLKKFLRMKYDLSPDYDVEILYSEEVLTDEFSLMDVAYSFSWNKVTPMRFQFRLIPRQRVPKAIKQYRVETQETAKLLVRKSPELLPEETTVLKLAEEAEAKLGEEESNHKSPLEEDEGDDSNQAPDEDVTNDKLEDEDEEQRLEEDDNLVRLEEDEALEKMEEDEALGRLEEDETMERLEEDEVNQRIEEEALLEEEALEEIDEDEEIEVVPEVVAPAPIKEEPPKKPERPNGLKRPSTIEIPKQEVETKKPKLCPPPKIDIMQFKSDEKQFLEDMIIEEDTDEDRLRISASEEEKSPDPQSEVEKVFAEKPRSEEKRKKKSKKGKHHHHHRHHDRKRCDSPPSAQIVHSPENDVMKLKVKLTAIKTCDNLVKGYTVSEGIDTRKEYKESKENGYKHTEKSVDKTEKIKHKEEEYKKKTPSPVHYNISSNSNNNNTINSNNNNINNISSHQNINNSSNNNKSNNNNNNNNNNVPANQFSASALAEFVRRTDEINKEKLQQQMKAIKKVVPKLNGTIKPEPMKMPPSSITVSKITAAEKRQMEQQKMLMNRSQSNGTDPKRPSLEIMLVNAPKKVEAEPVKKVMRPTPPSIPLARLGKGKGSPPPLRAVRAPEEALDLSGKSSRKSPELAESLRIPKPAYVAAPARPCKPNPTVRQIPNPSALLFRSQAMSGRPLPPPALPINSLRHIETMTKKIDKVAAGLTVKAAATGLFGAK